MIAIAKTTQAENLEAKDANGFSDPYCMLGIRPKINTSVENQVCRLIVVVMMMVVVVMIVVMMIMVVMMMLMMMATLIACLAFGLRSTHQWKIRFVCGSGL